MPKGKKMYKYQIVSEQRQPYGHMLYLIRYKADNGAKSERWIGQNVLRRYYEQERLTGTLSDHVKSVVTAELKKSQGRTRGKHKLEPRVEIDGPIYSAPKTEPVSNWTKMKEEQVAPKWNLKDFEIEQAPVATGRAYIITRADGRCCVVLPDGSLDDEWTPLMHAEIYRDSLNKEVDENKS